MYSWLSTNLNSRRCIRYLSSVTLRDRRVRNYLALVIRGESPNLYKTICTNLCRLTESISRWHSSTASIILCHSDHIETYGAVQNCHQAEELFVADSSLLQNHITIIKSPPIWKVIVPVYKYYCTFWHKKTHILLIYIYLYMKTYKR